MVNMLLFRDVLQYPIHTPTSGRGSGEGVAEESDLLVTAGRKPPPPPHEVRMDLREVGKAECVCCEYVCCGV